MKIDGGSVIFSYLSRISSPDCSWATFDERFPIFGVTCDGFIDMSNLTHGYF